MSPGGSSGAADLARYNAATASLEPPFAVIDLAALRANAAGMARRAAGKPIRGAGEVQTPLLGKAADGLRIGDRVWFRHAKAGELCERFGELHLVEGDTVTATVPTYRGEGQSFG
jgi:D-serine deaminase-like pyridoxal phosphate-dependent protein